LNKQEWSQSEYLKYKKAYEKKGIQTLLIDTINAPIDGTETILYNPYELHKYPKGTFFVFYCDTGKSTLERLNEFKQKFPGKNCISLRGGRGYWRRTGSI
jgi:hypothetical protein